MVVPIALTLWILSFCVSAAVLTGNSRRANVSDGATCGWAPQLPTQFIQNPQQPVSHVPPESLKHRREARSVGTEYGGREPIRIAVSYTFPRSPLPNNIEQTIRSGTQRAVSKVEGFLKVFRLQKPLVFERTPSFCNEQTPSKSGKCANIGRETEICRRSSAESVEILDSHTAELRVWANETYSTILKPAGSGEDSDLIVYIQTSISSEQCAGTEAVFGYAWTCQREQPWGRPTLGVIVLCLRLINDMDSVDQVATVVLHELLHVVGFSSAHFPLFKETCWKSDLTREMECLGSIRTPIVPQNGMSRFRGVYTEFNAQAYFNCSDEDFGPGVHMVLDRNGFPEPGSHWSTAFMYGSIMTPNIGLPHLSALDSLTMSVLNDSGWYMTDFSKADPFTWGQGQGCDFATPSYCNTTNPFFCHGLDHMGCHYSHLDLARCRPSGSGSECLLYEPLEGQRACFMSQSGESDHSPQSRCFRGNFTIEAAAAGSSRCLGRRCWEGRLYVRLSDHKWTLCPPGQNAYLEDDGGAVVAVMCPAEGVLCTERDVSLTPPPSPPEPVEVVLWFTYTDSHRLSNPSLIAASVREEMMRILRVSPDRVANGTFSTSSEPSCGLRCEAVYKTMILNSPNPTMSEAQDLLSLILDKVGGNGFVVILGNTSLVASLSRMTTTPLVISVGQGGPLLSSLVLLATLLIQLPISNPICSLLCSHYFL